MIDGEKCSLEEAHRKLWKYLSDNPTLCKDDWFCNVSLTLEDGIDFVPPSLCFACMKALMMSHLAYPADNYCDKCPLTWSSTGETCVCGKNNYLTYQNLKNLDKKFLCNKDIARMSQLAEAISNMEWRN